MRVLIQMGDPYPDESPCAKRMRTFHDVFTKNGDEVIVLAPLNDLSIEGTADTIYCKTVPLKKKNSIYRLLNSLVFAYTSYKQARKIRDVDVVITTAPPPLINWFGYLIAKYHNAKLVYDVRDIWPDVALEMGAFSEKSLYCKVFKRIRDFMLKVSDLVIAVSPGKVQKLQNYNHKAQVIHITNGLDEEFVNNPIYSEICSQYRLDDGFVVCYIGNLGLAQGLQQLMNIAGKAQEQQLNARFLLFGSGVEEQALKEYVSDHNLHNVEFPGRIPNKYIYTVLKHSGMCFISLVNDQLRDSVPTKLYEALGAGCPVLLAACGDAADVLNESRLGIAVRPNDDAALWDAFLSIYNNINQYVQYKQYAEEYVRKNHSRQDAARKLEILLHELFEL